MTFIKGQIPWNPKGSRRTDIIGKNNVNWKGGKIKKNCLNCGKEFETNPCWIKKGRGKFCSKKCHSFSMVGKISKSRGIRRLKTTGVKNPNWKGGTYKHTKGYVYTYAPDHPHKIARNYILEHRLIVEQQIGRYLLPTEEVHHLGAKDDNMPKMLMAFTNHSAHKAFERNNIVNLAEVIFDGRKLH